MISSVEALTTSFVFSRLLLTVLKALRISDDTFSASSAVSTKYIMLIIFCRGSRGMAMANYGFDVPTMSGRVLLMVTKNHGYGFRIFYKTKPYKLRTICFALR